jgi:hypothetical protein
MAITLLETRGGLVPTAAQRGYHILYRDNEPNHCPGCGRGHWYVGRLSAECAFCGTALPRANAAFAGGQFHRGGDGLPLPEAA